MHGYRDWQADERRSARQRWFALGGVCALFGGLYLADRLSTPHLTTADAPIEVSFPRLADLTEERRLADYRGEVVLVELWGSWCGNCVHSLPAAERMHRAYTPRGLRVVGIALDALADTGAARRMATELGVTFELLIDPTDAVQQTFAVPAVPFAFLLDRAGRVRWQQIGFAGGSGPSLELERPKGRALLEALLAESGA